MANKRLGNPAATLLAMAAALSPAGLPGAFKGRGKRCACGDWYHHRGQRCLTYHQKHAESK